MTVFLSPLAIEIITFMRSPEGQSQSVHMPMLSDRMTVPDDRIHGRQHFVSKAIEELRRLQLIVDVPNRCWACSRPPRSRKTVPLRLTEWGERAEVVARTNRLQKNHKAIPAFKALPIEDKLYVMADEFWGNLGRLVALTLDEIPKEFHSELLLRLQDKCSVYSVNYEKHLNNQK